MGGLNVGSPLQRYWTPFRCSPSGWVWEPPNNRYPRLTSREGPSGQRHYKVLTRAFVQAESNIQAFEVRRYPCQGLPATILKKTDQRTRSWFPGEEAFAGLERLVLRLATYGNAAGNGITSELFNDLTGLRRLLASMESLMYLELRLCPSHEESIFYTYEQVFPADKEWPTLEKLVLVQISIGAKDFMHLLEFRLPNLKHLVIGAINLLKGTWEGVFERLKRSGRLKSFAFDSNTYLYRCHDVDFHDERPLNDLYLDLERYALEGGRHPCLQDTQPNSDAQEYVDECRV